MTANLKRWDPSGIDGSAVLLSGTPLSNVVVAGNASLTYSETEGFQRGNQVGVILSSGTTDTAQANVLMSTAAAAAGTAQVYFKPLRWHTAGTLTGLLPILDLRSSTANLIRAVWSDTGMLTCQNATGGSPGGSLSGSLYQLVLGTRYRLELDTIPATGFGALRLYDDNGNILFEGSHNAGNFGTTQPSVVRCGESSTTANSPTNLQFAFSQLAIDTGTSVPSIPGVAKVATSSPTPSSAEHYPKVMLNSQWI